MTTKMRHAIVALALAIAAPAATTACTQQTSSSDNKINVVASTSVWGSIAEAIGGDKVKVTSLVHNPNQDPHSFEASVRDQAAVNNADLILLTGNGYDSFMTPLLNASSQPTKNILELAPNDTTVKTANAKNVNDPHVWYDLTLVSKIAQTIETKLESVSPTDENTFKERATTFEAGLAKLQARREILGHEKHRCFPMASPDNSICTYPSRIPIFQPESVGLRLIADFAVDYTPPAVRQAAQNETDISVQQMALSKTILENTALDPKTGYSLLPVRWLILNGQQSNAQTLQFTSWAKNHNVKIATFSETLPAGETYLSWMAANLSQLEQLRSMEYSTL